MTILFVTCVQSDVREVAVEVELSNGQRCEFSASQPGRDCHFVGQRSFDAEPLLSSEKRGVVFQPFPCEFDSSGEFIERQRLERPRRTASLLPRCGVLVRCLDRFASDLRQRSQSSHDQQLGQLRFIQCSTLPARVKFFVGFRNTLQRIHGQPSIFNAPVAERDQGIAVSVAASCRHAGFVWQWRGLPSQPAFQRFTLQVRQLREATLIGQPVKISQRVGSIGVPDFVRPQ
ncbi:MAG: hypothetical protein NT013_17010 [Planctomycetia bacterium]|nr:hypothetical protein [Planctomycetia bacterium]